MPASTTLRSDAADDGARVIAVEDAGLESGLATGVAVLTAAPAVTLAALKQKRISAGAHGS